MRWSPGSTTPSCRRPTRRPRYSRLTTRDSTRAIAPGWTRRAAHEEPRENRIVDVVDASVAVEVGAAPAVDPLRAIGLEVCAHVDRFVAAVLVEVAVARVPISVAVGVALARVGNLGAVVARIDQPVAIGVAERTGAVG